MNLFYVFYARCFEFILKLALPFLPYKEPLILNKLDEVSTTLKNQKKSKVLIITGPHVSKTDSFNHLINSLKLNHLNYLIYNKVTSNPTNLNVEECKNLYIENSCDSLIAFGGGSPIDCAKAAGALISNPKKNLNDLKGLLHVKHEIPLLIAIPTTSGSGSEVTLASVIRDSFKNDKYIINDFKLIPKYALLDESTTYSLPKKVVGETGMDALTHAIESYIGISGNKKTRKDAKIATKLIFSNLETSYLIGDSNSRKNMMMASFYAGRSFSKAYVGYVHAISHAIGGKYNLSHGLLNAIILPIVLKEYGKKIDKKLYQLALFSDLYHGKDIKEGANLFIHKITQMNSLMKIPTNVEEIKEEDILELSLHALKEANPLYPVPEIWNLKKMKKVIYKIANLNKNE